MRPGGAGREAAAEEEEGEDSPPPEYQQLTTLGVNTTRKHSTIDCKPLVYDEAYKRTKVSTF